MERSIFDEPDLNGSRARRKDLEEPAIRVLIRAGELSERCPQGLCQNRRIRGVGPEDVWGDQAESRSATMATRRSRAKGAASTDRPSW